MGNETLIAVRYYLSNDLDDQGRRIPWYARIFADFDMKGYIVDLTSPIAGPSITPDAIFGLPEEAAEFVNELAEDFSWEPEGDWETATFGSKDLKHAVGSKKRRRSSKAYKAV